MAAVTAAMYLAVASQVKAVGEVGVSWLGGGVRKRMVMESEGWWGSYKLNEPANWALPRCRSNLSKVMAKPHAVGKAKTCDP